jgi:hypothetical protein
LSGPVGLSSKEIVVHSLDQARAALAAARSLNQAVTLASAPDAALQTGPAWFKTLIDQAAETCPGVAVTAILDCGDQPGAVLAALRLGLKHIRFDGPPEVCAKLTEMGAILAEPPDSVLDLLAIREPESACRTFLGRAFLELS